VFIVFTVDGPDERRHMPWLVHALLLLLLFVGSWKESPPWYRSHRTTPPIKTELENVDGRF